MRPMQRTVVGVRGAAMLATTYGVGELSALNGVVAGRRNTPWYFTSSECPLISTSASGIAHHTLGDGVFGNFVDLSGSAACCHAGHQSGQLRARIERALSLKRSATISRPTSQCRRTMRCHRLRRLTSMRLRLGQTRGRCKKRWRSSPNVSTKQSPLSHFPPSQSRGSACRRKRQGDRGHRVSFRHDPDGKCVIDEGYPQFAGMYSGAASDPKARQIAEGADLVLDLGGVNLNDITTAAYSAQLDRSRFITVGLNDVRIGDEVIAGVRLVDACRSRQAQTIIVALPDDVARPCACDGQPIRQDHNGRALSPLCSIPVRRRHHSSLKRAELRAHADNTARRR